MDVTSSTTVCSPPASRYERVPEESPETVVTAIASTTVSTIFTKLTKLSPAIVSVLFPITSFI